MRVLIVLILLCSSLYAETRSIHIINAGEPYPYASELRASVSWLMRQAGVRSRMKLHTFQFPIEQLEHRGQSALYLNRMESLLYEHFTSHAKRYRKSLVLVVFPLIGGHSLGGIARYCEGRFRSGRLGVAWVGPFAYGIDTRLASYQIIAHEIAHLLGAQHRDFSEARPVQGHRCIMAPFYRREDLGIDRIWCARSKREIRRCKA